MASAEEAFNERAGRLEDLGEYITQVAGDFFDEMSLEGGELSLQTTPDRLLRLAGFVKSDQNCLFDMLVDLCGVDHPAQPDRFMVVIHFCSLTHNNRLRIKIRVDENTPVPSLTAFWPSADWYERECWDMYGVFFQSHPDLRRLLTDYGFSGHPLRKDFPLSGYTQVRYDEIQGRVVSEPVDLVQAYRDFDFESPWQGSGLLPGDEKSRQEGR